MSITLKTSYQPLTEKTAIALAQQLEFFPSHTELHCREIGDGNLNLVFHIQNNDQHGIIIKQALPYAKVVGESWPLTLHRATIEGNYLKNSVPLVPGFVPKVYHTDKTQALTIIEDLSHLEIVRSGFIRGKDFPLLSLHIGKYLATTLFFTSDFGLNQQEKKVLQQEFSNPELCKITEDLVLTDPFFNSETNNFEPELSDSVAEIWNNNTLKLEVAKLKYKFLTNGEALLHGDLHTGSIFASDTETKVIDPEFAFFGPVGFDIGQFFANILLQAITRTEVNKDVILSHLHQVWETFEKTFTELWITSSVEAFTKTEGYLQHVLRNFFKDAVGYAGCEVIRRTIGLAHVADLEEIKPYEKKIATKKLALAFGQELILQSEKVTSTQEIEALLNKVTEEI
ncbi:S-methyl-5-thioribose kinase [Sutcliffiella halmapala]|uniref:S-methyl-5-thioribose kinase n=1 Tax=Sutcliffiella halmapala TaxID=79882 RepID=UPI000994F4D4|nr:S-methyl-5-thioribose kinase [Sutcliffiella halmapala]